MPLGVERLVEEPERKPKEELKRAIPARLARPGNLEVGEGGEEGGSERDGEREEVESDKKERKDEGDAEEGGREPIIKGRGPECLARVGDQVAVVAAYPDAGVERGAPTCLNRARRVNGVALVHPVGR